MNRSDIPYRITLVETSLRAALSPGDAVIAVKILDWPLAEEERLFPRFSMDRYFVSIRGRDACYSVAGVLEWGVFWSRLDDGEPKAPASQALLWGTIDRLPSIIDNLANRLLAARSPKLV
jgi:hypothetical protein